MAEFIENLIEVINADKILDEIKSQGSYSFSNIMKIEFCIEENIFNESRSVLYLDFKVSFSKSKSILLAKIKFNNVSNLCLNKLANNIDISEGLYIHDMKNEPMDWPNEERFHIHDDSGYGQNDGYMYIDFYCESIEAIGLEEFPYEDF
ncbi:hypothetical protein ACYSNR_18575 [Enterococcus sp. LJL128]|uniref:hypothetical protein n=1 Tax=Enterococcus sp. LJL51 TaxID=3416656 RepID=UPI003CF5D6F8